LSRDKEGFIEVLNPFAPFLPLFCAKHLDTLLQMKSQGRVSVRVKKCCVSPAYLSALKWYRQPCILPIIKMHETSRIVRAFNGQTPYIEVLCHGTLNTDTTLGMYIIIKNNKGDHINRRHIRAFSILFTEMTEQEPVIISSRSTHVSVIGDSPYYNFPKSLCNGFYIPLTQIVRSNELHNIAFGNNNIRIQIAIKHAFTTSFFVDIKYLYRSKVNCYALMDDEEYDI
jgi:hypothetical protein